MTARSGSRIVALAIAAALAAGCGVPPIADMEYAWSEYRLAQRQPTPPDPVVLGEAERSLNEAQDLLDQEQWEAAGERFREAGRLSAAAREHRSVPGLRPSPTPEEDAVPEAALPLPRAPRVEPEPAPAPEPAAAAAAAPVVIAAGAGAGAATEALPEPGTGRAPSEVVPREDMVPAAAPPPPRASRRGGEVVPTERVDEPRVVGDGPSSLERRAPRGEAAVPPQEALRSEELEKPLPPAPPEPEPPAEAEPAPEPVPAADPEEVARRIAQKEVEAASARLASGGSAAPPEDAAAPPPVEATQDTGGRIYVVGSGETLWTIAGKMYGDRGEWSRIYEANRDQIPDPSQVYAGQKLVLPGIEPEPSAAPAPAPPEPEGPRVHVLGKGETLRSVAERYYGDAELWTVIYEANRARIGDPDRVRAGLELTVPSRR